MTVTARKEISVLFCTLIGDRHKYVTRHCPYAAASPLQSTSPRTVLPQPILLLSLHLHVGLPSDLLPSFQTKILCAFLHCFLDGLFIVSKLLALRRLNEEFKL
jgi:hypothetical protein